MSSAPLVLTDKQRAYTQLGVKESDVWAVPQITPQLREVSRAMRGYGPNGSTSPGAYFTHTWPDYLRISDDSDARKVLDQYHLISPWLRRHLPVEAFCLAAGVSPTKVLGLVISACVQMGANATIMLTALQKPNVVQKTIERAMDDKHPDAFAYSELFHKATGFLPMPKGAQTTVNVQANSSANAQSASVQAPVPEHTIRRMVDRFNEAQLAPAAPLVQLESQVTEPMPESLAQPDSVTVEAEYGDEEE